MYVIVFRLGKGKQERMEGQEINTQQIDASHKTAANKLT